MTARTKLLLALAGSVVLLAAGLAATLGFSVFTSPSETFQRHVYSAGHKALFMCSGVFVAGRDPEDILRWEIKYAAPFLNAPGTATVDYESRSAVGTTARGLIRRRAAFREGLGCSLMAPGSGADDVDGLPRVEIPKSPDDPARIPWPDGDLQAAFALPPAVNQDKLDAAMDGIFDGRTYYDPQRSWADDMKTIGVVVVHKGQIIAERYATGWDMHTQYRTYSAAKSFTNAIAGIRAGQGAIDIDEPLGFPEWHQASDPRKAITLRHFLHMSSGLECDGGAGNSMSTYFGGGRNAALDASERPLVAEPGTTWCYSNFDSISVARAVHLSLPSSEDSLAFPHRELFMKIGMRSTFPETDVFGNFIMSSQIWTTPRDLARLGLLYLNDGVWKGERILPEGWVRFTSTPAPSPVTRTGKHQPGYGAQFWLFNNHPRVPKDAFTAAGHGGQYATVIPSHELVIARMGLQDGNYQDFVADVVEAVSDHGLAGAQSSAAELGLGFAAKVLCSTVFLTGLDVEHALEASVYPAMFLPGLSREDLTDIDVDHQSKRVTLKADGVPARTAAYYGEQGCVLHRIDHDGIYFEPTSLARNPRFASNDMWPKGETLSTAPLPDGLRRDVVAQGAEKAFGPDSHTAAFIVTYKGRVVAERYGAGANRDSLLVSWSMGKSLTATLMGVVAQQHADFDITAPAPLPQWAEPGDPRAKIRTIDLLRMSSGLRFSGLDEPPEAWRHDHPDHALVYSGAIDAFRFSIERVLEFEPNTVGRYRNCDPLAVGYIVQRMVTGRGGGLLGISPSSPIRPHRHPPAGAGAGSLWQLRVYGIRIRTRKRLGSAWAVVSVER